jgi:hypothetical protein
MLMEKLAALDKELVALRKREVNSMWKEVAKLVGEELWDEAGSRIVEKIGKWLSLPASQIWWALKAYAPTSTATPLKMETLALEHDQRVILEEIVSIFITTGLIVGPPGLQLPTIPTTTGPAIQRAP